MGRNIVKVLEKKFADMKAGDRMYISSPEEIKSFIINIPRGTSKSLKEMRLDLANTKGADNTCPVTTGIFLRIAVEASLEEQSKKKLKKPKLPFWRIIDEKSTIAKKLTISKKLLKAYKSQESINE